MAFALKLAKAPQGGDRPQGPRGRRHPRPQRAPRAQAGQPVRRPAPARGDGPRDRARPEGVPDGRAAVEPRRQAARADARRGGADPAAGSNTTTVYVTHDQTEAMTLGDRVAVMLQRRAPAGRLADGALQQPGEPVRGRLHRLAGHELPARDDRGRRRRSCRWSTSRCRRSCASGSGASTPAGTLIAGIRPEDFEDAPASWPPSQRPRGTTFKTKFDLVEAMGAEYYAHFGVSAEQMQSRQTCRTCATTPAARSRRRPTGRDRRGGAPDPTAARAWASEAELWLDATKLHFFDADSGTALTQH